MKKTPILIILSLIVFVVMGALVYVTSQKGGGKFDSRSRASGPSGTVELRIEPTTNQYYVGDTFTLNMMLHTGTKAISAAGFRIWYPFTTTIPQIGVIVSKPDVAGTQIQSFASVLNENFSTNVNQVMLEPAANGNTFIDYSALIQTPEGYLNTSTTDPKLASIAFVANRAGTTTIDHDPIKSQITDKATGLDVLQTIKAVTITVSTETQKPEIKMISGLEENASTTSATVNFSYSASDLPVRQANVVTPLTSTYFFDTETAPAYTGPLSGPVSISKTLGHGAHTLTINVKDPGGNIGTLVRHFTVNLTPHINSVNPTEGIAGTQVTISGYNLTGSTIKFGTVAVATTGYVSKTATEMVVIVPTNAGGTITATNAAITPNLVSNAVTYTPRTRLTAYVSLQGIKQNRGTKTATVVLKCGTFKEVFQDKALTWDTTKLAYKFSELFLATSVVPTSTTCTLSVKEASRLRKLFTGISISPTIANVVDKSAATDALLVADLDETNSLQLQDFGILMSNFTETTGLSTTATDATKKFDLNGDGSLSIEDIGLLLTNLTSLQKTGDSE